VRTVGQAAQARAEATFDAANSLANLSAFGIWDGQAAESAREAIGVTRRRLEAHRAEVLTVAAAAIRAADSIERIRSLLAQVKVEAEAVGLEVDPTTTRIVSIHGSAQGHRATQALIPGLQSRLDAVVGEADSVDLALERAIRMADEGPATTHLATEGLSAGQDDTTPPRGWMRAVDFHGGPLPEKPSWTSPDPPAGGWSQDPITRAAQKIAYGHASTQHLSEFPPGTTREQLASEVERIFRANATNPGSLLIGRTKDGAPALYDPNTNTIVIRDANAPDAGTVFKPTGGEAYFDRKVPNRVPSVLQAELADAGAAALREPPRVKSLPPEAATRGGLPPMVGVPPMVGLPRPGAGELPVLEVDGTPSVGHTPT
jgi:hypothetical protein